MKFNKLRKNLVVLVGASVFLGYFSTASAEFTFLNTHPEASTVFLTTPWRGIREFTEYNDRLYMGYGANGATAAPGSCPPEDSYSGSFCDIKLRYLNPVNGTISTVQEEIRSQGMFTLNVHNGKLYALAEDPDPNEMLIRCTTSSCAPRYFNSPGSAHNFVSVEYQGALYVGGGSNQGYGAIWKSTNDGVTWNEFKQTPKDNSIVCCARVSFMEVLNGSLYAQATSMIVSMLMT